MARLPRALERANSLLDLTGQRPAFIGHSEIDLRTYTEEVLRSGFPGIRDLSDRARRVQLDTYITRVIDHDLPKDGVTTRRPAALLGWLTAYAAATASANTILDAATPGQGDKPARQTVRALAQHALASTFHLRTKDGSHEVDLIVEGDDRRVIAFEVKLNSVVTDADVKHLRWLGDQIGPRLADAAILTTGPAAYRRKDGIGVLPLTPRTQSRSGVGGRLISTFGRTRELSWRPGRPAWPAARQEEEMRGYDRD